MDANKPDTLTCTLCGARFPRAKTGAPALLCSKRCRNRARHLRTYAPKPRKPAKGRSAESLARKREYQRKYMARPEVRERYRMRWHNDPEYRARGLAAWRARYYKANPRVEIPAPYSGHRWLDMAREAVGKDFDPTAPWADDYYDDMGEAVLALLEGRDMKEAVRANRRKEYIPRKLTYHMGDWRDDDGLDRWFDRQMPTTQSAEDEYLDSQPIELYTETRFSNVHTKRRRMKQKTSTPSNRRSNNR